MDFMSTRNIKEKVSLVQAITSGLAPDGGLYIPSVIPSMTHTSFQLDTDYATFAEKLLQPFFSGSNLQDRLSLICKNAFNFKIKLDPVDDSTFMLELFHGPTLSFKDFGARFLAECLTENDKKKFHTVLVATSGDTGSAVASSFYKKPNSRVIVLFPQGKITKRQQQQITCWHENITALAVAGSFDDCQRLVKEAFQTTALKKSHLTSANSINIGRLLPQIVYYAYSSIILYAKYHEPIHFVVPSGNLGNITAAYWAKAMGFPIGKIAMACNANRVMPDYLSSGRFQPKPSQTTLANAMDVGNPSNFERLTFLFPSHQQFKQNVYAVSVTDEQIRQTIISAYKNQQRIICPHTATAYFMRQQLPKNEPWVIVATAHPCKFETIIEPLLNLQMPMPPQLEWMLSQPPHFSTITKELSALQPFLI